MLESKFIPPPFDAANVHNSQDVHGTEDKGSPGTDRYRGWKRRRLS